MRSGSNYLKALYFPTRLMIKTSFIIKEHSYNFFQLYLLMFLTIHSSLLSDALFFFSLRHVSCVYLSSWRLFCLSFAILKCQEARRLNWTRRSWKVERGDTNKSVRTVSDFLFVFVDFIAYTYELFISVCKYSCGYSKGAIYKLIQNN